MTTSGKSPSLSNTKSSDQIIAEYSDRIKNILDAHFKALYEAKEESTNISTKYDFMVRIEEVKAIYELLFKED